MKRARFAWLLIVPLILLTGCTSYFTVGGAYLYLEGNLGQRELENGSPHVPELLVTPTEESPMPAPEICRIRAEGGAWLRSGPGVQHPIVGSLKNGEGVTVGTLKDGWYQIENPAGWVAGWLVVC